MVKNAIATLAPEPPECDDPSRPVPEAEFMELLGLEPPKKNATCMADETSPLILIESLVVRKPPKKKMKMKSEPPITTRSQTKEAQRKTRSSTTRDHKCR